MQNPNELEIICRAYDLWMQAGCPEGKDQDFCRQAEQELHDQEKTRPASDEKERKSNEA